MTAAKSLYTQVNGCYHCSNACPHDLTEEARPGMGSRPHLWYQELMADASRKPSGGA